MAKSANQKLKLLYLKKILEEKTEDGKGLSIKEIIEELAKYDISAERKSLYDDFLALQNFGVDVEKDGVGNQTKYFIAERDFELPELKLLVDSVQTSKYISKKKSNELIRKIEKLTSAENAKSLHRQVYVENRVKTQNETAYHVIDTIHQAIGKNEKITFKYFDYDENKKKVYRHDGNSYVVSPWALVISEDKYYMIAFDDEHKEIRNYRVDKMEKAASNGVPRDGKKEFEKEDVAKYETMSFGMFRGEKVRVGIRFRKSLLNVMLDRFGHTISIIPSDDEHYETSIEVFLTPTFLAWLMNFGSDVEITHPKEAREKIIALAKDTLSAYEEK